MFVRKTSQVNFVGNALAAGQSSVAKNLRQLLPGFSFTGNAVKEETQYRANLRRKP